MPRGRKSKTSTTTAAEDAAEAEAAEARRIELDQQREANRAHALTIAAKTMTGDLRDMILNKLRHEQDKRPWDQRSESEQRETAHSVEAAVQESVRQAVEMISASGLPTIQATLESVMVKDGIKLTITMRKDSDQRFNIMDMQGGTIMIIAADADQFMGERAAVRIKPDQGDIEHTLAEHSGDAADRAAEMVDEQAATTETVTSNGADHSNEKPGWRGDRDFVNTGVSPLN